MKRELTLDERRRFKTHGRKKGFLKPKDEVHLKENLAGMTLMDGENRQQLLAGFGASKESGRLWLEIGFGNGDFLAHLAALHPDDCFVGIDVFLEGVSALFRRLQRQGSDNVRVIIDNANIALMEKIPAAVFDRVVINFPDPWPKKRHHKRRLIQTEFLDLLAPRMRTGSQLSLATDWLEYAHWMLELLEAHPAFVNTVATGGFAPEPEEWITTRFQTKGQKAGRPASHLLFNKVDCV